MELKDLPNLKFGRAKWGHFDNDNKLDFVISGKDVNDNFLTLLFQNKINTSNSPPSPPNILRQSIDTIGTITFSWDQGTDDHTPSHSLSYNLYVFNHETKNS